MSTVVSHVLSVGITMILIMGLMTGATGFLDDHGERTAREELETIGNRLAAELDKADTLARGGDNVTLTSNVPDRIAGSTYTAQLVNGTAQCDDVSTVTCLKLSATDYSHQAVVPVNNKTKLTLRETSSGRFIIDSPGGNDTAQAPTRSIDLSSRVGIGNDVGSGPPIGVGTSLEQKPIAQFTFRPGQPQVGHETTFDAGESTDPDGTIEYYNWTFDDGTQENKTSPTYRHTFRDGGWQNVTLRVTDDTGSSATRSREIRVSGLEYEGDLENETGGVVSFTVTNEHNREIEIERILIDPDDGSLSPLESSTTESEIEIDSGGFVEWDDELTIPSGGVIVDIDNDGDDQNGNVVLNDGDTTGITVRGFDGDTTGKKFTFGVRYQIGDRHGSTVFTDRAENRP